MKSWEYKTLKLDAGGWMGGALDHQELEIALNDLGIQGWELVSIFDTNFNQGSTRLVIAVLKRERN